MAKLDKLEMTKDLSDNLIHPSANVRPNLQCICKHFVQSGLKITKVMGDNTRDY